MNEWEPSYRGEPRPGNRTFVLIQRAIDNGWTPFRRNSIPVLAYRFYWFIDAQYMEVDVPSLLEGEVHTHRVNVSEIIFGKAFAKALVGPKRYRKLLTGAVLSRSPVDYMYREVIDRNARIGRRI
jgi:hypothetical protein